MIERISVNSVNREKMTPKNRPGFKGGLGDVLVNGTMGALQACEANPMLNVTVLDLVTAIIPRTAIEGQTNPYAGLEAFRRESSGLIVNCLIPSFIVLGIAKLIQGSVMGGNTKMASCWANEDTIRLVTKYWDEMSTGSLEPVKENGKVIFEGMQARVYRTIEKILKDTSGVDGDINKGGLKSFESMNFHESIKALTKSVFPEKMPEGSGFFARRRANQAIQESVNKAYKAIVDKTHAAENIKIKGYVDESGRIIDEFFSQGLGSVVKNTPQILRELVNGQNSEGFIKNFSEQAAKLVKYKSLAGLGVIIPLAISMQPINRWITAKTSGKKGAPIYKDFAGTESKSLDAKEKASLLKQKFISVGAMILVAGLSIMKKIDPKMIKELTQFKNIFPTMDQARLISTATFASRMMASEDRHDLREATVRDIATFSSFYFLGDYVAKGIASAIEACNKNIKLINVIEKAPENTNIFQKAWHWTKGTALKSSDEVIGETAKKMRSLCQLGNIAFSLVALGILIPKIYRGTTDKEHEKELKEKAANQESNKDSYPSAGTQTVANNKPSIYNAFSQPLITNKQDIK